MYDYNFDVMLKNNIVATIHVDRINKKVQWWRFEENPFKVPFYLFGLPGFTKHEPNYNWVEKFLIHRTFPRERGNCRDILNFLGLDRYNIWDICRKTHGVTSDDPFWLRFPEHSNITRGDIDEMYMVGKDVVITEYDI